MVKLLTLYAIGAEKDHIVPWDAASRIQQLVAGKTRYVLASSPSFLLPTTANALKRLGTCAGMRPTRSHVI